MRKVFLTLALAVAAFWITAAPAAAQDNATSVTFTALHIDCSSSVGTASFTFKINGTTVGTVPFTQGCACNSAPLTATFNDAATLALVSVPACNLLTVQVNDPQGGAYFGYAKADITRAISGTESICIADQNGFVDNGGTCANRDICTGYQFSPGSKTNSLLDSDGDAAANCSDTDDDNDGVLDAADNCPVISNASQADGNGDGIGDACEPAAITVPWLGVPTSPHQVYSTGQLILQGTVRMDPSFSITSASWDPGDGTGVVALSAPFNPRVLELAHTYTGSDGTPYTAVLTATVSNGTISKTVSDTFRVVVRNKTLDVEADMAIDKGLWYLHKQMSLGQTTGGVPNGRWTTNNDFAATSSAVQAFEINNHRENGNRNEDPYVDDVARGMTFLLDGLAPMTIGVQTAGNPDSNGNGIGLTLSTAASVPEGYVLGQVLDAIVASGTQTAVATVGHATAVLGRTYKDIVQDLMDSYSWGQADPSHGGMRGGWWYDLNAGSDTSAAQWGAIAGLAAQTWGITVPAFVKSENLLWVDQSSFFDGSNAGIDGRFDYDGGNGSGSIFSQSAAEAPSGLVMMVFDGLASTDPQYKATERYISRQFYNSNVWSNENHIYGMYAMAKGFRLATPPVTTLDAAGNATPLANFDWYRSEPVGGAPRGVARILIGSQQASGRWDASQWVQDHLSTAWGIIILSPTIFQLGPTAACEVEPSTTGVGGVVSFDGTGSIHNDPGGVITGYSWDFTDSTSATGSTATHAFTATGTYNVVLTVTDANGLTDTATCQVNVIAGALPPNSNPGPAYSFCAGSPMVINGGASSDPDGTIVSYEWDWSAPLNFTPPDATGVSTTVTLAPGTYDLALRVTDDNGNTDTDFTSVTVKPASDPSCNQPPTFTPPTNITTPATSGAGAPVTFTANGNDPEQGPIAAVCVPPSGSTFPIGTTTVNCTVTDNGGLTASGSFTVTVTNNTPTFTPPADITVPSTSAAGAPVTFTANGSDVEDGPIAAVCAPTSGSTFPIGTTTVNCTVTDAHGASVTGSFTVTVTNHAPTFAPPANITTPATSAAGAPVTFTANGNDFENGSIAAVCVPPSGSTFPIGTTMVNCTVTDNNGASATGSFTVTVTNNAPTFTPPANITVGTLNPGGTTVTFIANGSDVENGVIPAVCMPASGSNFPIGTTTVNCTVTDGNGASTTGSFTVTVTLNNQAPVCSAAAPSVSEIWPANHQMVAINLGGITDPDGNPITVSVTSIAQDEPTNTQGDGNTSSDASGIGTAVARVRAERQGGANGRFYHISFTATDSAGASCTGTVKVVVPHDQGKKSAPVDGGKKFNSVTGAALP